MSNRQSLMFPDIYADVLDKRKDYNGIIIDPRVSAHIRETALALACISLGSFPPSGLLVSKLQTKESRKSLQSVLM